MIDATQNEQRVLASLLVNRTQYRSTLAEKYGANLIENAIKEGIIVCTVAGFTSITDKGRQRFNSLGQRLEKSFVVKAQTMKPIEAEKPMVIRIKAPEIAPLPEPKRPRSKLDPRLCEKNYARTFDKTKVDQLISKLEGREYEVQMTSIKALAESWGMKLRMVRDKAYRLDLLGVRKFTPWNDSAELRLVLKLHKLNMSQTRISKVLLQKGWHRSRSMIYRKLQSMGLVQLRVPGWTQEEKDFLLANYSKMTFVEMSSHIKRKPDAINMKAVHMGLQRPKKMRNAKS